MSTNIITSGYLVNDSIDLSKKLQRLIEQGLHNINDFKIDDHPQSRLIWGNSETLHQFLEIQKSFLYVCTETVYNYPSVYLSEKSFKGITVKRPFIILGAPKTLQTLKTLGFKTFDDYWDESYDLEMSDQRRLIKIYSIIKKISKQPLRELEILLHKMQPILEYNFNHYAKFGQNELLEFYKQCTENYHRNVQN